MHPLERIVTLFPWRPSVCPSGTGVHCDHTVHFNVDLSLWLDNPIFRTCWHQSMSICSEPSFSSSTWKRGVVWTCIGVISQERLKTEVKLLSNANRKSYMPRQLAQQRMTLSDLEWLSTSRIISAVAKLLVSSYSTFSPQVALTSFLKQTQPNWNF